MIESITYNGKSYPSFQAKGNASQFAIPFAKHVCSGIGVDVGCGKAEWAFPGARLIDPAIDSLYSASNFPEDYTELDYIFSSHCLEHLPDWVGILDYWVSRLRVGGVLFLYLPDYSQEYWRPWNNRKHCSVLSPTVLHDYLLHKKFSNIFSSGTDLNNSFMIMGSKVI